MAKRSLQIGVRKNPRKTSRRNHAWFVRECKIFQKHVKRMSNLKHRDPHNTDNRDNYHNFNNNFNIGTTYNDPTTSDPLNKLNDPISEIEIISATKKLKTKKAPGLDRIRNEMLKCGFHYLASSLSILFNTILKSGYLPASWSKEMITAIYKLGDKSDPSNYRGICVSSCLSKLFCSILNQRLRNFIQERNLLHPSRIEFLPGFRTSDHIFSLRTITDMNQEP